MKNDVWEMLLLMFFGWILWSAIMWMLVFSIIWQENTWIYKEWYCKALESELDNWKCIKWNVIIYKFN